MHNQEAPNDSSWWERIVAGLPATTPERDSIWSVPRPFVRLYLVLFAVQAGWLISLAVRDVVATLGYQGVEAVAYQTLSSLSQPGVGAAIFSLLIVEVISYLMVMYNFLMHHLVRPVIQRHERRGEARGEERGIAIGEERGIAIGEERGIAIGEERGGERERERWEEWNQRRMDAAERGEPFDEPPPPPRQHRNGADGES